MGDIVQEKIGVIGGSGLYSINQLKEVKELDIDTPFGSPSDNLLQGKIDGLMLFF